ncbi:hypothetical protein MAP00_003239 [Monascus purpureus]|nr:hypothetical protein MAP00_003239 [Monascus purpureus]
MIQTDHQSMNTPIKVCFAQSFYKRRGGLQLFHIAIYGDNFDVLCKLIQIYLPDTSLTEPLEDHLKHFHVSPVVEACATANEEMVLWLMNHDPPLGTLHYRDSES